MRVQKERGGRGMGMAVNKEKERTGAIVAGGAGFGCASYVGISLFPLGWGMCGRRRQVMPISIVWT
jgi:hypothetical protein